MNIWLMGLHTQTSNLIGKTWTTEPWSYVFYIKCPTVSVALLSTCVSYFNLTVSERGTWMYDWCVSFKTLLVIFESYDVFAYAMSEHLLSRQTSQYSFLLSRRLHLYHYVYDFFYLACIIGKIGLFWLTNNFFEFEFEMLLDARVITSHRFM